MAISNHERVGRALKLLHQGLYPYFEREMKFAHGGQWLGKVESSLPEHYTRSKAPDEVLKEDVSSLLIALWENWNTVFRKTLGQAERTLVSELRTIRNDWAHSTTYSTDNAYRALDSISRLLTAIAAPEAAEIDKQKQEVLRIRFEEQARRETRKSAIAPTEGQPTEGLKPWREIATPHPDVASGQFQQAEFAADLWQVYLDEGSDEYRDPTEFYRRTYLTEGLKQLLSNALLRLSSKGGDPVIELQTNFGGGKTHAMLALFHLCNALNISDLPGMEPLFDDLGLKAPPRMSISPSSSVTNSSPAALLTICPNTHNKIVPSSEPYGGNSPGNWGARRVMNSSARPMKPPPIPAIPSRFYSINFPLASF